MQIAFRVDASDSIGSGHLVRCLVLARYLRKAGCDSVFIITKCKSNLGDLIFSHGFKFYEIKNNLPPILNSYGIYETYNWYDDAEQCSLILKKEYYSWLVVDHYALDYRWEKFQKEFVKNILVVDDLANRRHQADILLDQNMYHNFLYRYDNKVDKDCVKLLGTDYVLMQSEYRKLKSKVTLSQNQEKRLLIYFGNSALDELNIRVLEIFLSLRKQNASADIILSGHSKEAAPIKKLIQHNRNIRLHGPQKTLAFLMSKADIAIGAGGSTTWERICMGLPSIVITISDNQKQCAEYLDQMGLIRYVGNISSIEDEDIRIALKEMFIDLNLQSISKKCFNLIDGKGVIRVAEALLKKNDLI